jgi:Do/DeqQ family serine protease
MEPRRIKFVNKHRTSFSRVAMIAALVFTVMAASYFSHRTHGDYGDYTLAAGPGLDGPDIELLEQQNKAFERIIQATAPAVVYIGAEQVIKAEESPLYMDPFFRQFFGESGGQILREQRQHALGTGVVFEPDGYIVTNNHVIDKASSVEVMLTNKKVYKAKVVGTDPDMDIAVIKIDAKGLAVVPLGNSNNLHVGDTVMAIGNPFGLNFTVTRGAVSALGRSQFNIEALQDFIQTDAAINPGNSGGALIDIKGQMVGINTAILSGGSGGEGGGSIGIGFAIPINMAKRAMESLMKTGKVTRGYLGVTIGPVTQELAQQFKVPDTSGAFVQDVSKGGPADRAGVKPGDLIRKFNGRNINDASDLLAMVASVDPGSEVTLAILRNGEPLSLKAKLDERAANLGLKASERKAPSEGTLRGISVQELTPGVRKQLELPADVHGVVVGNVDPSSPAAQQLQPGDIILSVNRVPVNSVADFNKLAAEAKGSTLLRIMHEGQGVFIVVSPESGSEKQ